MGMENSIKATHNMFKKRKEAVVKMLADMETKKDARSKP